MEGDDDQLMRCAMHYTGADGQRRTLHYRAREEVCVLIFRPNISMAPTPQSASRHHGRRCYKHRGVQRFRVAKKNVDMLGYEGGGCTCGCCTLSALAILRRLRFRRSCAPRELARLDSLTYFIPSRVSVGDTCEFAARVDANPPEMHAFPPLKRG
jgi:hypothetical protein